MSILLLLLLLE